MTAKPPRRHSPEVNRSIQSDFKNRQLAAGYVRRPYYATTAEHEEIKTLLKTLRKSNSKKV